MSATQAMTGQGGWPMTVFMTPDGEPFLCGTYFPRARFVAAGDRGVGAPGRRTRRRSRVESERISARWPRTPPPCRDSAARRASSASDEVTAAAVAGLATELRPAARRLRRRAEVPAVDGPGVPAPVPRADRAEAPLWRWPRRPARRWRAAACTTSSAAASPGTAWTRTWTVPHFEKMLYDNALLAARLHAPVAARTGSAARPPGGGGDLRLHAPRAAHPRGRPRRVARRGQRREPRARSTCGPRPSCARCSARRTATSRPAAFGVTAAGTFEHGTSVLQRPAEPRRARAVRPDSRHPADGPRGTHPPGPRRQGGRGLERHGDRRARRGRACCSTGPTWSPPRRTRPTCWSPCITRDGAGSSADVRTGRRGRAERGTARGLRLRGGRPADAVRGDRAAPLGARRGRAARHRPRRVRRR